MKKHKPWLWSVFVCILCLTCNVFAFSGQDIPPIFIGGYGGYDDLTGLITADVLVPVMMQNYSLIYAYGQGRYGYEHPEWAHNTWSMSLGAGYRKIATIKNYTSILGAYLFGDYSETATGHGVMELSPGVESLGTTWDFRINGYLPFGTTSWKTQGWADNFGNNDYVNYSGHDQYDAWFIYHEEVGPGTDAEVGRNIIKIHKMPVKGFINGYYYHMSHNSDIMGLGVRATFKPCKYLKISLQDSYDNNRHNVIMAGVELALYDLLNRGAGDDNGDLVSRLFDPIERNFGAIDSGSIIPTTGGPGLGNPDVIPNRPIPPGPDPFYGHHAPERTNVWFFSGSNSAPTAGDVGDVADGTYEHPFSGAGFTQDEVKYIYDNTLANNAYQNAYLYFNQGTYNAYSIVNGKYQQLQIYPGESLWGRMGDHKGFQKPATGANRPNFIGGLQLDSNTSINDLALKNDYAKTKFINGVVLDDANGVAINNVNIYVTVADISTTGGKLNAAGIEMDHGGSVTIKNSTVTGWANATDDFDDTGNGFGIHADGTGNTIVIDNSVITGIGQSAFSETAVGNGYGILVGNNYKNAKSPGNDFDLETNNNTVKILNNSMVEGESLGGSGKASGMSFGVFIGNNYVYLNSVTNSAKNSGNIKIAVLNNKITVDSSKIQGGNYGVLIGNNMVSADTFSFANANVNAGVGDVNVATGNAGNITISIASNDVKLTSSTINADVYGVLIGNGTVNANASVNATAGTNVTPSNVTASTGSAGTIGISIASNKFGVTGSNINSKNYGVIIGNSDVSANASADAYADVNTAPTGKVQATTGHAGTITISVASNDVNLTSSVVNAGSHGVLIGDITTNANASADAYAGVNESGASVIATVGQDANGRSGGNVMIAVYPHNYSSASLRNTITASDSNVSNAKIGFVNGPQVNVAATADQDGGNTSIGGNGTSTIIGN